MSATRYKIWAIGKPMGQGASNSFHVGVAGIAKGNSDSMPYIVANELLCGTLASLVLLPIPPSFLIDHDNRPHFVSLNFNLAGEDLPPADPAALVAAHAELAGGIVAFDVWIANSDRHAGNLAFDQITQKVQIYDHCHAFYPGTLAALTAKKDDLAIGGHCLSPHLNSLVGVKKWCEYMGSMPEWQIRECVQSASQVGLPANEVDPCVEFLVNRRLHIVDLMTASKATFPNVPADDWP
jgi:hypothetical protein